MLKHLPENLKSTLLLYSFNSMIRDVEILEMNANFTAILLTHLKLLKLEKKEILYREDDPSQEIYFISKGSIKLVTDSGQGIFTLVQGTHFGELEILEPSKRLCFAQASEPSVVIVCDKTVFLEALKDFPDVDAKIRKVARYRKEKLETNVKQLEGQQNVSSPTFHKASRKLLKSTDYFYNVLLKHGKTPKKNKNSPMLNLSATLRKGQTTGKAGGSPTNKNISETKKPFNFSAALERSKPTKAMTLKERILAQQAKESRLSLQQETLGHLPSQPNDNSKGSINFNDGMFANDKKEELKINDILIQGDNKPKEANSKENFPNLGGSNNRIMLPNDNSSNHKDDSSGHKEGNLFVKTANFLDLVNSDENRNKNAQPVLRLQDRTEEGVDSKSLTPKTDNGSTNDKTPENMLLKTKQKLANRADTSTDKPIYLSAVHDGLSEVRKLKEEAELLYSQMDTKKQNIVEIFSIIAERQIDINTTVEKLFSINK